jgi:hypothetical protein
MTMTMGIRFFLSLLASFCCTSDSMAVVQQGCRVCTSSSCTPNGSELLLEALQTLLSDVDPVDVKRENCLGGCGGGVIVKNGGRRKALKPLKDEAMAISVAAELLRELNGLDEAALETIQAKLAAGERVLSNCEAPEICSQCGIGLQLYRGKCAKCGKYPY